MQQHTNNVVQFQARGHELHRHFTAPGVIEGPFTSDTQAHHDWEDQQHNLSEGWERIGTGLVILIAFCVVMALWGVATERFAIDWTGVARLFGVKH